LFAVERENRMTLDERLTRLTERHEALTQHVEMLTVDVRATTENVNKLVAKVDDLATGFTILAQLARRHEERLDFLEGRKG